jgi:hypothetical protein
VGTGHGNAYMKLQVSRDLGLSLQISISWRYRFISQMEQDCGIYDLCIVSDDEGSCWCI